MKQEQSRLDSCVSTYRKASSFDDYMRESVFKTFEPFMIKEHCSALELGCSDGYMTEMISKKVTQLVVVEGSGKFIDKARERNLPNVKFIYSLFEDFNSKKKYDYVFATYILTHIADLKKIFKMIHSVINEDGLLFIVVPNSRALSRQLAVHMGLINDLMVLSENDLNHGHCRAYDRITLNRDIETNGFKIISQGGVVLKILADFQMDIAIRNEILREEQLEGLNKLGHEYPDLSGALYVVCQIR